jgi:hypothetical protein
MLQSSKLIQVTDKLYFVGLSLYLWSSNYTSPYIIIRLIILQSKFLHNLSIACFGFFCCLHFQFFIQNFPSFSVSSILFLLGVYCHLTWPKRIKLTHSFGARTVTLGQTRAGPRRLWQVRDFKFETSSNIEEASSRKPPSLWCRNFFSNHQTSELSKVSVKISSSAASALICVLSILCVLDFCVLSLEISDNELDSDCFKQ